jgi:hypothetical protein
VNHFAADVDPVKARVMHAVQQPLAWSALEEVMGVPAWKSHPTWFMVADGDQAIPSDAERQFAARMGAATVEISTNHVAMVSHPDACCSSSRPLPRPSRPRSKRMGGGPDIARRAHSHKARRPGRPRLGGHDRRPRPRSLAGDTLPGVPLEQARRGVQQERQQRAVGFGPVEGALQGAADGGRVVEYVPGDRLQQERPTSQIGRITGREPSWTGASTAHAACGSRWRTAAPRWRCAFRRGRGLGRRGPAR